MTTTKKILFHEDGIVNGEVVFKKGEVYDIPVETGSAARWIRRGAEEVIEAVKVKEEVKTEVVIEESKLETVDIANVEVKAETKRGSKSSKGK